MTAGSGTPMWVRALRAVSVLLGIAAFLRARLRTLTAPATTTLRTLSDRLRGPRHHPVTGSP
ncbi:hypothetical protein BJY24_000191 [Nocardia transvalensis]|uniref:Uncharacterized protein n=1 Tax=Nocardia transvalensis TaxID=37333 RepID=A0A7W9P8X8_9NOCA|nr:hypothetical protein [Nocardia transvalensis]MBB5911324.1 hypothetical protein [Nocardia transvalensis]